MTNQSIQSFTYMHLEFALHFNLQAYIKYRTMVYFLIIVIFHGIQKLNCKLPCKSKHLRWRFNPWKFIPRHFSLVER